jgi:protein HOOK3
MLELSRLRAENQLLKSGTGSTTVATLRIELEEAERARKHLDGSYRQLTEENAIVQEQLRAIAGESTSEKSV